MRRLTVLLAALSVAGCSLFRSDPKPKIAPLPEIKSPLAVRTLWSLELGTAGASTLTPAIADKAVFAAARDGSVVRVDAASGKVLWRTATGIVITGGVGADGETVVVGTMNNAGTVLLTVADMSVIEAEVEVDETDIPTVMIGQPAKIKIDAFPDKTFPGKVTEEIGRAHV